jgi:hypothetical protein
MRKARKKKGSHSRAESLRSQADRVHQIRAAAIAQLSEAMKGLTPKAIESAKRGRVGLLRLLTRWFRMPPMKSLSESELHDRILFLERQLADRERRIEWADDEIRRLRAERTTNAALSNKPLDNTPKT